MDNIISVWKCSSQRKTEVVERTLQIFITFTLVVQGAILVIHRRVLFLYIPINYITIEISPDFIQIMNWRVSL